MLNFDLFTDSSCDLPKHIIEKFDLKVMATGYTVT